MPAMPLPTTTSWRVRATGRSGALLTQIASVGHARRIRADRLIRIFEATAGDQAEVMLVDRRGHDQLALHVADDAARQHVGVAVRIVVVERVDGIADAEDRDLPAVDQRATPASGKNVVELADEASSWIGSSYGLLLALLAFFARRGPDLAALLDEHDVVVALLAVDEVAEALERLRIVDRLLPFALVGVDRRAPCRLRAPRRCRACPRSRPASGSRGRLRGCRATPTCAAGDRRCGCRTSGSDRRSGSACRCRDRRRADPRGAASCRRCRRRTGSSPSRSR